MDQKKCPTSHYLNCKNSNKKCKICIAGPKSKGKKLLYEPIKDIGDHPAAKSKIDSEKSRLVRGARKKETTVLARIASRSGLKFEPTLNSGATNGDGDGSVGPLSFDHKLRTTSQSFTVTKAEWEKGLRQGVNAFAITRVRPDGRHETAITLTEDALIELLSHKNKENGA